MFHTFVLKEKRYVTFLYKQTIYNKLLNEKTCCILFYYVSDFVKIDTAILKN